jgi:hypothetical protein
MKSWHRIIGVVLVCLSIASMCSAADISKTDKKQTLEHDITVASDWVVKSLNYSGYKVDYTVNSMKELDRFFETENKPGGILSKNRGQILFGLGAYVGQTAIKLYGGKWITNDVDPYGEAKIAVKLSDGSTIWPVIKCMKRYQNGKADSIYEYFSCLQQQNAHKS